MSDATSVAAAQDNAYASSASPTGATILTFGAAPSRTRRVDQGQDVFAQSSWQGPTADECADLDVVVDAAFGQVGTRDERARAVSYNDLRVENGPGGALRPRPAIIRYTRVARDRAESGRAEIDDTVRNSPLVSPGSDLSGRHARQRGATPLRLLVS